MDKYLLWRLAPTAAVVALCYPSQIWAHGFAGQRFFPATIQTDDPFVADEMSLPTLTLNPKAQDGSRESDVGFDLAKRITPNFGLTVGDQWKYVHIPGEPHQYGWDNLETGAQYQLFVDGAHEAMALAGIDASWAHTGRVNGAGADDFTTISLALDFGKGFGDLPDWLSYARPFALTANLGLDFPTKTETPATPIRTISPPARRSNTAPSTWSTT